MSPGTQRSEPSTAPANRPAHARGEAAKEALSSAFGLGLSVRFELPGLPPRTPPPEAPLLALRALTRERLPELWSGASGEPVWRTMLEGDTAYALLRGREGDHLALYAERPSFHLSADGLTLSCAEPSQRRMAWARTLLDTVLWSAALLNGVPLLHASAVLAPTGVVAIAGPQGAGKSSLAAQLLSEGWPLFSDDILAYRVRAESILAYPGPAVMNLPARPGAQPQPQTIGRTLQLFEDGPATEAWVALAEMPAQAVPLRALVLLERGGTGETQVTRQPANALSVIPHTLAFRKLPGAQRRRFESASDLAQRVPVFCIRAATDVPPGELAAALRDELESPTAAPARSN